MSCLRPRRRDDGACGVDRLGFLPVERSREGKIGADIEVVGGEGARSIE